MPSGYNALAARPQNRLAYPGQDVVNAFTQGLGPMLYGAAKGTAATIAGMPGDIEQLARQLLLSGAVSDSYTAKNMATQALLPTSDRVRAMLPSLPGAGPQAQYSENMGATLGQNVVGNLVAPKALPAVIRAGQDLPVGANIKDVSYRGSHLDFQYPQQTALDLAQQRAALPVEQGGLGLPATNTAMDRAKAMGFTTEGYRGSTVAETTHQNPLWWSEDPQYASAYAAHTIRPPKGQPDPYAGNVMPLLVNIGKSKEFEKFNIGGVPTDPFSGFKEGVDTGFRRYSKNEITGDMGGKVWEALTLPQNVRSRFAAFDPFRKTAATAAAMGVAAPDLMAASLSVADQIDNINEVLKKKRKK